MEVISFDATKPYDGEKHDDKDIAFLVLKGADLDNAVWRLKTPIIVVVEPKVGYTAKIAKDAAKTVLAYLQIKDRVIVGGAEGACNKVLHWAREQGVGKHWFQTDATTVELVNYYIEESQALKEELKQGIYKECERRNIDFWKVRELCWEEVE